MRTTAQNKGGLVWALECVHGVVPSHLFLKSGRDRSTLQAFLSQCALVKGPDNRQKDARVGCRQTQMLKNIARANRRHRRWRSDVPAKYAESAQSNYDKRGRVRFVRSAQKRNATSLGDVT